ncbi:hypothetical protein GLOTRDRAFT_122089 [Gloeophyllum trabeum ATCC 11539]|uniref:Uncharacterized protein n=1 Tax=Gloeophyllum trabeum (strain ATCC 11539 / FP-39264 / Madison 617) TaxID=670483 RepID=S7RJ24_GLOTA|nr:uncharacterized protein GLOTRDRAFT_122089 [Gloeophyllum trabeum ATCC 11539]EPQ54360.1 hypothetical protein GLOTRDRAFT_122089 [Gloeophyllum trabeum ATCC 11539]
MTPKPTDTEDWVVADSEGEDIDMSGDTLLPMTVGRAGRTSKTTASDISFDSPRDQPATSAISSFSARQIPPSAEHSTISRFESMNTAAHVSNITTPTTAISSASGSRPRPRPAYKGKKALELGTEVGSASVQFGQPSEGPSNPRSTTSDPVTGRDLIRPAATSFSDRTPADNYSQDLAERVKMRSRKKPTPNVSDHQGNSRTKPAKSKTAAALPDDIIDLASDSEDELALVPSSKHATSASSSKSAKRPRRASTPLSPIAAVSESLQSQNTIPLATTSPSIPTSTLPPSDVPSTVPTVLVSSPRSDLSGQRKRRRLPQRRIVVWDEEDEGNDQPQQAAAHDGPAPADLPLFLPEPPSSIPHKPDGGTTVHKKSAQASMPLFFAAPPSSIPEAPRPEASNRMDAREPDTSETSPAVKVPGKRKRKDPDPGDDDGKTKKRGRKQKAEGKKSKGKKPVPSEEELGSAPLRQEIEATSSDKFHSATLLEGVNPGQSSSHSEPVDRETVRTAVTDPRQQDASESPTKPHSKAAKRKATSGRKSRVVIADSDEDEAVDDAGAAPNNAHTPNSVAQEDKASPGHAVPLVEERPDNASSKLKENAPPPVPEDHRSTPRPSIPKAPRRSFSIKPKSTPMSELIRRVNSQPGSPFAASTSSPHPLLKASKSALSRIAPLHPNRRTPPPPPPRPPKPKERKSKKQLEMEEEWEMELEETIDGWLCLTEAERDAYRKAKRDQAMGWEE